MITNLYNLYCVNKWLGKPDIRISKKWSGFVEVQYNKPFMKDHWIHISKDRKTLIFTDLTCVNYSRINGSSIFNLSVKDAFFYVPCYGDAPLSYKPSIIRWLKSEIEKLQ